VGSLIPVDIELFQRLGMNPRVPCPPWGQNFFNGEFPYWKSYSPTGATGHGDAKAVLGDLKKRVVCGVTVANPRFRTPAPREEVAPGFRAASWLLHTDTFRYSTALVRL
jgi:hypothetical protein